MTTMTEEPVATISRDVQAATILQKCVCLSLSCHYLGNNRKVDLKDLVDAARPADEGDADKAGLDVEEDQFHATKRLIPTKELAPVMRVFGKVKHYLRHVAIAGHHVFGERSYLVPSGLLEEVDRTLVSYQDLLFVQAQDLSRRYDAAVAKQQVALGPKMFKAGDYISAEKVAASFSIDWDYVSFKSPDNLEKISHVLAARSEQKHTAKLANAFDEVLIGLRASALEVMTDLEDRLAPGNDGKTRTIRGTALRDLQQFITYLPQRNITGDDALTQVMANVAARAEGYDIGMLRDSDQAREQLRQLASEAKAQLAGLVETGRRGIAFGSL